MFNTIQDVQQALVRAETRYYKSMSKYSWFDKSKRPFKLGLKYYKRIAVFKGNRNRVTFDPVKMQAYSYNWWRFVDRIDGMVVFNNATYSSTTSQHQSKVRALLRDLGINIDVQVVVPKGLQNLQSGVAFYESEIQKLVGLIQNPRSRKDTNKTRATTIRSHQDKIAVLNKLIKASKGA